MNRSEKAALIAQIKAKADAASFVVVTDFKGMTVEELTRLRAKLYECGGEYLVVKNTLARIALTLSLIHISLPSQASGLTFWRNASNPERAAPSGASAERRPRCAGKEFPPCLHS